MLQHEQFLSSITGNHNHHHHHNHHQQHQQQQQQHHDNQQEHQRPLQQSSPSDQSVSTGTPPHPISRGSPASTALVMSSNNIASSSRQLTPNGSSASSSSAASNSGTNQQEGASDRHHRENNQHQMTSNHNGADDATPNPMMRQFAGTCHSKSMSAGVVVPVPGISSNLATATGMQQNNMINNTIQQHQMANNSNHLHFTQHQQMQHQQQEHHQQQQQHQQQQYQQGQMPAQHHHHTLHHPSNSGLSQQHFQMAAAGGTATSVSNKRQHQAARRSHHHRSVSSQNQQISAVNHHHQQQQQQQQAQAQAQIDYLHQQQNQHQLQTIGSSQNFLDGGVGGGSSSIILSNQNINNIHNRSASTHLSSLILSSNHHNHHSHHNAQQQQQHQQQQQQQQHYPQASQRTSHISGNGDHHHHHHHHHQHSQIKNSIWSIDDNISKSHGKLTASGFLHPAHSYLLHPSSITDISCDNVSTASRLMAGGGGGGGGLGSGQIGMGPNGDLGGPVPGYYSHHAPATTGNAAVDQLAAAAVAAAATASGAPPPGHHNSQALSLAPSGLSLKQAKFLPICDLMFNLISMIIYFCENVFGIIALIALYYHASSKYWALAGAAFVLASNLLCQYLSLRWLFKMKLEECRQKREAQEELENEEECERRYYNRMSAQMRNYQCGSCTWLPDGATEVQLKFLLSIALDAVLHIFCLGFLVRYIKLVIPVSDTSRVKREARDLCMLRMIHGFVQSAPLLLLQAYMVCSQTYTTSIANLSTISVILSLINVCWALASFTKYARKKYMHKFVLTWLGILSQLLWRLGTISSRVAALTIYAVYYNYWMLVVLALHWITMFMWLVKPGNLLRDETNMSRSKKLSLAVGASWIYCFCYMNFEEHNSRTKMGIFYLIMFVENNLLFTVCQAFSAQVTWFKSLVILVVYLGFVFGMLFMVLYYKYFHVNVLNSDLNCSQDSIDSIADQLSPAGKKIAGFKPGTLRHIKNESDGLASRASNKYNHHNSNNLSSAATLKTGGSHPEIAARTTTTSSKPPYLSSGPPNDMSSAHALSQSGVFNCKLNNNAPPPFKKPSVPGHHVRH